MASYRVELARSAEKDLRKIDPARLSGIFQALESLSTNPRPTGVKKLAGAEHTYRVRIGSYRIVYDLEDDKLIVFVIRIAHRKEAYK